MDYIKKHWFKLSAAAIMLVFAVIIVVNNGGSKTEFIFDSGSRPAYDFQLTNVDGKPFGLADTDGKAKLVYFYFSHCPDVCQPTTYMLSQVQDYLIEKRKFGSETAIYSITFDPERDTQQRLKEYSANFVKDESGWFFLRQDDEAASKALAEKYGVAVIKNPDGNFTHGNFISLVDKKGNLRHIYTSDDYDPKKIGNDLIRLSKE